MNSEANKKKQVYQLLSKGKFITEHSRDYQVKSLYENIKENEEEYRRYFAEEGLILDHGRGYYQFCFEEPSSNPSAALSLVKKYISIYNILIAFRDDIGVGTDFTRKDFYDAVPKDEDLQRELQGYTRRENYRDVINDIIAKLREDGIIERFQDDDGERFFVTSAYNYLEDLYDETKVYNEES